MPPNPERRDQIADAGLRVLAASGARGLTHRAVDRAAHVPEGTTANYYASRDALLGALAARIFDRLAPPPAVFDRVGTLPPTVDQAVAYVRDIVARTTRHPELTLALFELRLEAARRPGLAPLLRATLERTYAADVAFHEQARLPGGAREIALLHYGIDGLLLDLLTVSINGRRDTEQVVDDLVRRILSPPACPPAGRQ